MNMITKTMSPLAALGAVLALGACDRNMGADDPAETTQEITETQEEPRAQAEQGQRPAEQGQQPGQQAEPTTQAKVRTVAEITGNPMQFEGEKVVVQGDVEKVHEGHGFRLDDEAPLRGGIDDDLLVLGAKDASWRVDTVGKDQVRVEGTIRRVKGANLEQELGWMFEPDVKDAVEDEEVVLIADDVKRMEK